MRSSCQTRALTRDASTQGARPTRRPCRMVGGKRPVPRPDDESGLKPSLATTSAKASRRVIADPLPGNVSQELPLAWVARGERVRDTPHCHAFVVPNWGINLFASGQGARTTRRNVRTQNVSAVQVVVGREAWRFPDVPRSKLQAPRSKPGTCVTQARCLYVSRLANSV